MVDDDDEKPVELEPEPQPQARGGRRRQRPLPDHSGTPPPPPARSSKGHWLPGHSGNPHGMPAATRKSIGEITMLARDLTTAAIMKLHEIVHDPKSANRDKIFAAAQILDRGLGRPAQAVFHGGPNQVGSMPTAVELLADDVSTPLTRIANAHKGAERASAAELRRELARIDAEDAAKRDAKEQQFAEARAALANGEQLPGPMALLLKVRDEKE